MAIGMSAFKAVFWSGLLAIVLSYIRSETALTPPRLYRVLRTGGRDVLGVAATTATAGIIVGVVTLTGLGLKLGVIVTLGGTLALTVVYSAIAVWLLGLAVPVTASYIIAAVMVAPALVRPACPTSRRTCSSSTTPCCPSESADGAVAVRGSGAHRRKSFPER